MLIVELTTGLLTLYSAFVGSGTTSAQSTSKMIDLPKFAEVNSGQIDAIIGENLEKYVRDYFHDTPILLEIAKCESTLRQQTLTGKVVRGEVNPSDVGLMQINEDYHQKEAINLGYDIHSLYGNMAFAKPLYEREGLRPWLSSAKCWSQTQAYKQLTSK